MKIHFLSTHFQALGVFGLCQIHTFVDYLRSKLSTEQFGTLFRSLVLLAGSITALSAAVATATGSILFKKFLVLHSLRSGKRGQSIPKFLKAVMATFLFALLPHIYTFWCLCSQQMTSQ